MFKNKKKNINIRMIMKNIMMKETSKINKFTKHKVMMSNIIRKI
jgi:hypothetical protein